MVHLFNTGIASVTGVDGAIMLNHLFFWIQKNAANNKNYHDGRYWTYNSRDSYAKFFRYWTGKQVRRILENLITDGYVMKGNYNENRLDRTTWFTFTDKGLELLKNNDYDMDSIDCTKWDNAQEDSGQSYTDNNITDNNIKDKEEKVNTGVFTKKRTQKDEYGYDDSVFDVGMKKNYPNISSMKKPLRYSEYQKLLENYSKDEVVSILKQMENHLPLRKKYVSAYLTANNWLRNSSHGR